MSTIIQPCFESQLMETATVKLKFAPPKSVEFSRCPAAAACLQQAAPADAMEHSEKCHPLAMHVGGNTAAKTDLCGLSFQQVLANICSSPKEATNEKESAVYVHPLSKRSSSLRLSEKSFEMCTENLGSETGTDIMDSSILSLSSSINSPREKSSSSSSSSPRDYSRNKVNSRNFPPPLTTMSGANSLQVRPHREGGRLVIRAIETPVKHAYLRAERSNGRLKLCLLKDHHSSEFDSQVVTAEEENNDIDNEEDDVDVVENIESYINDADLTKHDQERQDNNEEDDEDDESDAQMISNKDIDANNFDIEVEMGMDKFQRLRRCNEGGHSNTVLYKPLWVATS